MIKIDGHKHNFVDAMKPPARSTADDFSVSTAPASNILAPSERVKMNEESSTKYIESVNGSSSQLGQADPVWGDAVRHYVDPDGRQVTILNVGSILNDDDKAILNWPAANDNIGFAGLFVAIDRVEGTLTGPLTREYMFGNPQIPQSGLIDRLPLPLSSEQIDALAAHL